MSEREIPIVFEIGLVGPRGGQRKVGVDADGTVQIFTVSEGVTIAAPIFSFKHSDAMAIARSVLAGNRYAMTTGSFMEILAAAVVLLDQQLGNVQSIVEGAADVQADPVPAGRFDLELKALDL